jgi:hypothetical protein
MADVTSTLASWSSTSASNKPEGSTNIGTGLAPNLREIQGVLVRGLSHKGSDIASAATTDIGAVEGLMHDITGTTSITSFGTVRAGIWKILKFEGALTLTHNGTSLILPGAANITTADGDVGVFVSEGSGNWRCLAYMPAAVPPRRPVYGSETALSSGTAHTITGIPSWVKRITILGEQVSTNGTDDVMVQIGPSGGLENTGYTGSVSSVGASTATYSAFTTGFGVLQNIQAAGAYDFTLVLELKDPANNTWQSRVVYGGPRSGMGGGTKTLSGVLTQFSLTTTGGANTFDGGSFSYYYE